MCWEGKCMYSTLGGTPPLYRWCWWEFWFLVSFVTGFEGEIQVPQVVPQAWRTQLESGVLLQQSVRPGQESITNTLLVARNHEDHYLGKIIYKIKWLFFVLFKLIYFLFKYLMKIIFTSDGSIYCWCTGTAFLCHQWWEI